MVLPMNPVRSLNQTVNGFLRPFLITSKRCFIWIALALVLSSGVARAGDPDGEYIGIYIIMHDADELSTNGNVRLAYAKYVEAYRELTTFQQLNPDWNNQLVAYRLQYLTGKIETLSGRPTASSSTETAASTGNASHNRSPAPRPKSSSAGKSAVKLLDAGSEPRVVLRLHPAIGDKQTMSMTIKMTMGISAAGKIMPSMNLPAMVITMATEVKNIAANGDINYDMTFDNATIAADTNTPPPMAAAMKAALSGLSGMTGSGRISNQGINLGIEMKAPEGASPQLTQAVSQMKESFSSSSTPFPSEAVGPGAKWEYANRVRNQGMIMDQAMTFELVSIDGDQVTLHSTLSQSAANQTIQSPSMPGQDVELVKLRGSGTGSSVLNATHILPVSATIDANTGMTMAMNLANNKQTMNMNMDMNIVLESK